MSARAIAALLVLNRHAAHLGLLHAPLSRQPLISRVSFGFISSAAAAAVIRFLVGREFLNRNSEDLDGLSVIAMLLFAIAGMDSVTAHALAEPLLVLGLIALAFAISLGSIGLTGLLFLRGGPARALRIGLLTGSRNIGITVVGFGVPDVS
jgi:bile acid:Na+ symporter, BASS family